MKFDKSKVYTALNADESLIGAKGYFDDDLMKLKDQVVNEFTRGLKEFKGIERDYYILSVNSTHIYNFFYLVEPAPDKWYVHKTIDDEYFISEHYFCSEFEGTKEECEQWIEEHSKPKYRPFKDCDELANYSESLHQRTYKFRVDLDMPIIWVKDLSGKARFLITCFGDGGVSLNGSSFIDLNRLYNQYTFLNGSPCGVEE